VKTTTPRVEQIDALAERYRKALLLLDRGEATPQDVAAARDALAAAELAAREAALIEDARRNEMAEASEARRRAEVARIDKIAAQAAQDAIAAARELDATVAQLAVLSAKARARWEAAVAHYSEARTLEGTASAASWVLDLRTDGHGDALATLDRIARLSELCGPDGARVLRQVGRPYAGADFFEVRYRTLSQTVFRGA
jgi:hypothetical protein